VKIETDHIVPRSEGGSDSIDNAIPVCFECHAEIHSYNDKHPRGRKFLPDELRGHKEQWLEVCKRMPEIFINAARDSDVGPIHGLIDELEFNSHVSKHASPGDVGCAFHDDQFRKATQEGSIAILSEDLKMLVLEAYRAMGRANQLIRQALSHGRTSLLYSEKMGWAREAITEAEPKIAKSGRSKKRTNFSTAN
jgi:HNH endonuclease